MVVIVCVVGGCRGRGVVVFVLLFPYHGMFYVHTVEVKSQTILW